MTPDDDALARLRLAVGQDQRNPMGFWSAPGRVNLIGEHTDYNDGFVLPLAIAQRTAVSLLPRNDRAVSVRSSIAAEPVEYPLERDQLDRLSGWSAYPLGVVWALAEAGVDLSAQPGVDIVIDSDVPLGAGLSSSAAIECATALALNDYWNLGFDRPALAKICQRAENVAVGAPTGIMDQSVSLMACEGFALFLDCRNLATELVPLGLEGQGLELLVIDTTVRHSHANGEYASRRQSCESASSAMGVVALRDATVEDLEKARAGLDDVTYRRARHIITENARVHDTVEALREQGPRSIGELLTASHRSMRDDFEISCPELDLAVDTALSVGALGARMTGGGFGGAAIALVDSAQSADLAEALRSAFAGAGYAPPVIFSVVPHGGAIKH